MKPQKLWEDPTTSYLRAIDDPWMHLIASLQDRISVLSFMFFNSKKMKTLHLPITTSSISSPMGLGSDSKPVNVSLFGIDTYLADSMQFMLEYGCRIFSHGCYYIMPSFRGEACDERHLCQFYHSEAEIIGKISDVKLLIGEYITFLSENLLVDFKDDIMQATNGDVSHIVSLIEKKGIYPEITMRDAVKLLSTMTNNDNYIVTHPEGFNMLTNEGEKKLIEIFNGIVWLTNFDHLAVPFYQAFSLDGTAINADLLFGIGETVGCGERHESYSDVKKALSYHQVNGNDYDWYINLKQKYPLKTSGFGMGIERFILWLLKHDDIRDCQLLPRINGKKCVP